MTAERLLVFVLRIIGSSALLAAVFVVVPRPVMNAIHESLGMGELPEAPVVGGCTVLWGLVY